MFLAANAPPLALDVTTLALIGVGLAGLLGMFFLIAWLQARSVRALAWWGSAYVIGAAAMAMWSAPSVAYRLPSELPVAVTFLACGMMWNGVRLFHGRHIMVVPIFIGPAAWLILAQLPGIAEGSTDRFVLAAFAVSIYTFVIAFELWREQRKTLYSRLAAIGVPLLHAAIFLFPIVMRFVAPEEVAEAWPTVFAVETMIYAVGTAFIVLLTVKEHDVSVYRDAASLDHLTGLLNRRAFFEKAQALCLRQGQKGGSVSVLMFDLDHFKSINDRFGHAIGDDVLRVFAQSVRSSMRASDIVGRLGGEEFAAIVPGGMDIASKIAERVRSHFENAAVVVDHHETKATVSVGGASSPRPTLEVGAMLVRADAALYRAKNDGRNRFFAAADLPPDEIVPAISNVPRRKAQPRAAHTVSLPRKDRVAEPIAP